MARDNLLGLAGFEFCELTGPDAGAIAALFGQLGFVVAHRHPTRDIIRYKQGRINLPLNREAEGQAADFRAAHGPSASGLAFRVADAKQTFDHVISQGATAAEPRPTGELT
jgi:4-hydroxyphenylpyruvate dioxygenase